jgi:hypothetical protein
VQGDRSLDIVVIRERNEAFEPQVFNLRLLQGPSFVRTQRRGPPPSPQIETRPMKLSIALFPISNHRGEYRIAGAGVIDKLKTLAGM